jgi:hypothetical protein
VDLASVKGFAYYTPQHRFTLRAPFTIIVHWRRHASQQQIGSIRHKGRRQQEIKRCELLGMGERRGHCLLPHLGKLWLNDGEEVVRWSQSFLLSSPNGFQQYVRQR